ncbi:hypothetical protein HMPREF1633_01565 [Tissierellia bacterium S5-A11]|nr:hypothetical protein HMPREF1633_01565 [Tissierellia bacterium S5-A11]
MTLEELKEVVESTEDWAKRMRAKAQMYKSVVKIPMQNGEWVKNIWYLSNEPLYYALEKIKMTDRYAKAIQEIYAIQEAALKMKYSYMHPTAINEVIREELEYLLHAEPSEEEMTLAVEIPDTRTEAQKAWDGIATMMNELEADSLMNRLKE